MYFFKSGFLLIKYQINQIQTYKPTTAYQFLILHYQFNVFYTLINYEYSFKLRKRVRQNALKLKVKAFFSQLIINLVVKLVQLCCPVGYILLLFIQRHQELHP